MASLPSTRPLPHAKRADVFNALFTFIQQIAPPVGQKWQMFTQWVRMWDEVDPTNQPCIILHRGPQQAEQKHAFGVTRWAWKASLLIYYRVDGYKTSNTYPDQVTDPLLDSIEQCFQVEPPNRLTLGGLVHHCWIDGTIYHDPGLADNQAVILVPLTILL